MKVAILHEMLVKLGGAEKVVESLLEIYPKADLFTLIYDKEKVGKVFPKKMINKQVFSLASQKRYNLFKNQRLCLNVMGKSVEALDFSKYDLVIASSSSFAHGAITKPETKFIVYYHSPSRYLWDYTNEYKKSIGWYKGIKGYILNKMFLKLRQWDYIASQRVDTPVIASKHAGKRIKKYYNRNDYTVIYPPVEIDKFINYKEKTTKKDYYITIVALTEWKRVDISIKAFNKLTDKKLKIIGVGDYEKQYKKMRKHPNIEFLGYKSGNKLIKLLKQAKGFIYTSEEDFGIAPVEAMACGLPVFGLNAGGLTETNISGTTGEFFNNVNGDDFLPKFISFDKNIDTGKYDSKKIINHAKNFSSDTFKKKIKELAG